MWRPPAIRHVARITGTVSGNNVAEGGGGGVHGLNLHACAGWPFCRCLTNGMFLTWRMGNGREGGGHGGLLFSVPAAMINGLYC